MTTAPESQSSESQSRESQSHDTQSLQIGEWLLEPELNQLSGPGGGVHLEPRTTAVLLELARHAGRVRTREELLGAVWGDAFVGEAALTHCIWELRKAFGDDAKKPSFIQTIPRRGYRLMAPVAATPTVVVRVLAAMSGAEARFRELLASHGGEWVTISGAEDSAEAVSTEASPGPCVALFTGPDRALRFALAWQSREEGSSDAATGVGLHLGEVEIRGASEETAAVTPRQVNAAAADFVTSLQRLARPRQILVTRSLFDVARTASETLSETPSQLRWLAHGDYTFSRADGPVEVFEVGVEGLAPLQAPGGTAGAQPSGVIRTILGWRPAPGLTIPQRPHWELERKLGEGGFGEVWLTRHAKTGDARVFKFCVEIERLEALQREVTLFRLLKDRLGGRRDIARILDWNFGEAPYFLELEYLEGGSLADWAAARGGLSEIPLSTRLEIVAQAAEALAAAHSVGILHKDVKPGNLLIDPGREDRPRVLLTDFGIGRLEDRSHLENAGITALGLTEMETHSPLSGVSGTRLYLAPELLEGKMATIQSDIYALGVVLYQTAVGGFDRALGPGWRRNVEDPLLAEDIARCIDMAPERRPRSGLEIAEGLRMLEERRARLAAERRQRQEAEATRRALEQARRRRKWLVGLTASALAVAAVVSVLTWTAVRARDRAERSRDRAERLVSFMLGDLRGTLEGVGRLDAMETAAEEVLDYYASLDVGDMNDEALAQRAAALRQIGDVRSRAGAFPEAETAFEEAARVAASLVARDPARGDWRADQADGHFWLGDVRRRQGDLEGAREAFAAHRSIYQDLARRDPTQKGWRLELAYGHGNLGTVLAELGQTEEALEHLRSRLAITGEMVAEAPKDSRLQLALASSHQLLGQALETSGDLAAAGASYEADYAILQRLAREAPEDTRIRDRLATSAGAVGLVLWMSGQPREARPYFEAEAAAFEHLAAIDPEDTYWQQNLALATSKVGRALQADGELPAALARYRSSREILERLVAKDPAIASWRGELATLYRLIAGARLAAGDPGRALGEIERTMEMMLGVLADRPADPAASRRMAWIWALRGEILDHAGEPREARAAWEQALATLEPLARDSSDVRVLDPQARALIGLGRRTEAQPILDQLRRKGYRAPDFAAYCRRFGIEL